jgi:hypothetical protein
MPTDISDAMRMLVHIQKTIQAIPTDGRARAVAVIFLENGEQW